jgi:Cu/Ag efflux pump CusA
MEVVNHYNIRRVVDVYANVQDRDLGGVSRQITKILNEQREVRCHAARS